ncbi:MAG TPA: Crp/Fnr family transcriptional regulator [Bacteroidales bacterium]|nr:Crp/Fnr family transcriptional regulator [Bacteroidales bacterium]HPF03916.1 Crp/Fnr family transcriptional regulator [Bacteroidales bacterium]HPJ58755.1 Crp/Fnr family transcriptional regulator [Bacteroidales bacterium]HPR11905.1 Crp/Fnr family transcriptional regulator [Bacteroidales bacterium]HRW85396.1 Crp/Fnr family transcriptional regulator [Bacteroidales bacterium]
MKTILNTDSDFFCDIDAPCFRDLTKEETELIRKSRTQVLFRKGENLTKQGAFSSYVLFVINGLALQYIEGTGPKNFNLRIIKAGEFIGLSAVFNENIFTYSTVAITGCQVYLIEREAIVKLVKKNGNFGFSLMKRYCIQSTALYATITNLTTRQMNGRMADTLIYIDGFRTEFPEIFTLLTRRELADFAGISTESAVKLLKVFEKEGIIELHDKDIIVRKHDSLAEIRRIG